LAVLLILQGTKLYNPKAGVWRELGMLDVMQVIISPYQCLEVQGVFVLTILFGEAV